MTGTRSAVVYLPHMVGCEKIETASVSHPLEENGQYLVRERISRLFLVVMGLKHFTRLGQKAIY